MRHLAISRALLAVVAAFVGSTSSVGAQSPVQPFNLDYWAGQQGIPATELVTIPFVETVNQSVEIPVPSNLPVAGLGISGDVLLHNDTSALVRVILVASDGDEYLVYEAYPLAVEPEQRGFQNRCEDTCVLDRVVPLLLRMEVVEATLKTVSLTYYAATVQPASKSPRAMAVTTDSVTTDSLSQTGEAIRATQVAERARVINRRIAERKLRWVAGDTPIARLSYQEKQALFQRQVVPNLQGFEYYIGGIFDISGVPPTPGAQVLQSRWTPEFDWRSRHGANSPDSPYFDGDLRGGGWITSVKWQRCGDCWAHAAVGAVEAQANLYYNQHIDLDLSEQQMVSCSGAGTCRGGSVEATLAYIRDIGAVEEACFPESGRDEPCANMCTNPSERIRIADYHHVPESVEHPEELKQSLINHGPIALGMCSWGHVMVAVGYQTDPMDGGTTWIFKNSWGSGWGQNGYGYVRPNDLCYGRAVVNPVVSILQPRSIACFDLDGDGYFNWGIDENPPSSCAEVPESHRDCDDSDASLGPFAEDGGCSPILDNINDRVSFEPDPSTYSFKSGTGIEEHLVFSDDFESGLSRWASGAYCDRHTIQIVDGRVQATANCNFIETFQQFDGNLRVEVDIAKDGPADHTCWDFGVELRSIAETTGIIRFDHGGVDSAAIGRSPPGGCGDNAFIDGGGTNSGTAILTYDGSYIAFRFVNADGAVLDAGRVYAGEMGASALRIHLAAHSNTPRYVDNVRVYAMDHACPAESVGRFSFNAALRNTSETTLANMSVRIAELGNGNSLLTEQGLLEEGQIFTVAERDDYSDGLLGPSEVVEVPFTVCLRNKRRFRFFVDVLGQRAVPPLQVQTPWQMNVGEGIVRFGFAAPYYGWEGEYEFATIPAEDDAKWVNTPDPYVIDFSMRSTLFGVVPCREGADFTYFQSFLNIPLGLKIHHASITVLTVDDGLRVSVFNSKYPGGHVVDYALLYESKVIDLKEAITTGEKNRIVLTHTDDCQLDSELKGVRLYVRIE